MESTKWEGLLGDVRGVELPFAVTWLVLPELPKQSQELFGLEDDTNELFLELRGEKSRSRPFRGAGGSAKRRRSNDQWHL
jgi:hypothetical protein